MTGNLLRSPAFWGGVALLAAAITYLLFGYFQVQAAFIDREVNEEFVASSETVEDNSPTETTQEMPETTEEETTTEKEAVGATTTETTEKATPEPAPEPAPEPSGPVQVSAGTFHDVEYEGTGDAIVYRQEDGSYVLRLENLNVENGPDLFVYAVAANDAFDAQTVLDAGFVDLGTLKGNQGNQTYELPPDFDPEVHRAISVWCQQFTANFVTAPLGTV